jgi:hypothetical protein
LRTSLFQPNCARSDITIARVSVAGRGAHQLTTASHEHLWRRTTPLTAVGRVRRSKSVTPRSRRRADQAAARRCLPVLRLRSSRPDTKAPPLACRLTVVQTRADQVHRVARAFSTSGQARGLKIVRQRLQL